MASSIVVSKMDYSCSDNYTTDHPNRKRWAVELKITSGTFSGSFHALMESDPDGRSYCVDTPDEPLVTLGGGEYYIDIEALMVMILTIQDKNSGTETITLDGDDGYEETIAFNTKNGQLFLEYDRLIEHGGFDFKVEIENPEEFLKSFYEQLLAITKTKPLDDEE
jgi:hypothetical protein